MYTVRVTSHHYTLGVRQLQVDALWIQCSYALCRLSLLLIRMIKTQRYRLGLIRRPADLFIELHDLTRYLKQHITSERFFIAFKIPMVTLTILESHEPAYISTRLSALAIHAVAFIQLPHRRETRLADADYHDADRQLAGVD